MRSRLVSARIITLLVLMRMSADLTYPRKTGLPVLNRRLIWLIGAYGGLTSVELVALTGQEKAQISRAVQTLSAANLIERASLRARIRLSAAGRAAHELLVPIARERNDAIWRGIARAEHERFVVMSQALIDRARLLFRQERDAGLQPPGSQPDTDMIDLPVFPETGVRLTLIAPILMTLSAYLNRSATIAFRRETGLTKFIWQILSQIGEHQPITLARLIALSYRDKSQVGRAVKWLASEGIVTREKRRGRRDVTLACTPRGDDMYAMMCAIARDRDDALCADLSDRERQAYIATLDRITANAAALLARERATPLDRPMAPAL